MQAMILKIYIEFEINLDSNNVRMTVHISLAHLKTMIGENRQLDTDEPVEFEK